MSISLFFLRHWKKNECYSHINNRNKPILEVSALIQKQKHEPKCGTVHKNIPKMIAVCAVTLTMIIPPAFAADTPEGVGEMFQAINIAWRFLCSIFAIGAVLSIASFAFAFFGVSGSKADEAKISRCKTRMITVLIAAACMFLIPTAVNIGRDIVENLAWDPNGTAQNHIVQPKDPGEDGTLIDVPESSDTGEEGDA